MSLPTVGTLGFEPWRARYQAPSCWMLSVAAPITGVCTTGVDAEARSGLAPPYSVSDDNPSARGTTRRRDHLPMHRIHRHWAVRPEPNDLVCHLSGITLRGIRGLSEAGARSSAGATKERDACAGRSPLSPEAWQSRRLAR